MKREEIEKAAREYVLSLAIQDKEAGAPIKETMSTTPIVLGAFKDGANWYINSVWHEASEIPDANTLILCITKEGEYFLYGISQYYYEETVKIRNVIKWAYIDDLLPNKEG